jgi:hypothetical protein
VRYSNKIQLEIAALQDNRADAFHLIESAIDVARLKLNSAAAIEDDVRVQAELACI